MRAARGAALNVRALRLLGDEASRRYLRSSFMWFDRKEILRADHGGNPLAVRARQVDLPLKELQQLKTSVR